MDQTTNPVIKAIDECFADKSQSAAEAREALEEAVSHAEMLIEALKSDMDE